jgi:hypothetical protein
VKMSSALGRYQGLCRLAISTPTGALSINRSISASNHAGSYPPANDHLFGYSLADFLFMPTGRPHVGDIHHPQHDVSSLITHEIHFCGQAYPIIHFREQPFPLLTLLTCAHCDRPPPCRRRSPSPTRVSA